MNTPSEKPASADAPPPRAPQAQRERRESDRRTSDRRRKDRRARRRKAPPMRMEMKVLLGLLVVTVVYFVSTKLMEEPPTLQKMVVVEIDESAYWQCSPKDLAQFFAAQDIMKNLEEGKELNESIRQDQVRIITNNLISREYALLGRVRKMPWKEFGGRGTFVRNGKKAEPPEGVDYQEAIKKAVMKRVPNLLAGAL